MAEHHIKKTYDPITGFTDEMWYDDIDKKIHVRRTQKVSDVYKENEKIAFNNGKGFSNVDGLYHKARIPNAIIEKWLIEDGFNWFRSTDAERRKKLNENPHFHVRKGRL
jgi:hypothetical protein